MIDFKRRVITGILAATLALALAACGDDDNSPTTTSPGGTTTTEPVGS